MQKPLTGIPADKARSYFSIEGVTSALRESLGLEELDRFDALAFFHDQLSEIKIETNDRDVDVVEGVEDCPQEGLTRWDVSTQRLEVILSQGSYELLLRGQVRGRSTVAHETGHALLHTAQIIRLAGMGLVSQVAFHRNREPHKAFRDTEWQANAFGSCLLMPAEGLLVLESKRALSVQKIVATYGVSEQSASIRLETFRRSLGL